MRSDLIIQFHSLISMVFKMNLIVLCIFSLLCLFQMQAASKSLLKNRIIGGKDASRGQFAYNVALTSRSVFFYYCGGSIITNRHILSAAHCVSKYRDNAENLVAILNTSHLDDDDFTGVDIEKVYPHPDYRNDSGNFDISIILTSDEIQFSAAIQPVCLPTMDFTRKSGARAIILGWGAMWVCFFRTKCNSHAKTIHIINKLKFVSGAKLKR